jgi:predicted protein tyrosine phosphatase
VVIPNGAPTKEHNMQLRKVFVTSRANMKRIFENMVLKDDVAVISIATTEGSKLVLNKEKHSCFFLPLAFYDVSTTDTDLEEFSMEQAEQAVKFVDKVVLDEGVKVIICHCDGGISRSAGMAAAIAKHYFGDDSEYFKSYSPNILVYRRMLITFNRIGENKDGS